MAEEFVTVAVLLFELSASDVAVTIKVLPGGSLESIVRRPPVLICVAGEVLPVNDQLTLVLVVPLTVAVNCWLWPLVT